MRAIVDAAVALAEKGGFEAVRLRDVAEASGVALGTLYKYFRSKEDILLFAVHEEAEKLEAVMAARPARGATPTERVDALLRARDARLHAAAEPGARGDPLDRGRASTTWRQGGGLPPAHGAADRRRPCAARRPPGALGRAAREAAIANTLNRVWFASLVGWAGGLHSTRDVGECMRETLSLLLEPA